MQGLNEILTTYLLPGLILAFGLGFYLIYIPTREGLKGYRMARSMMGGAYLAFFVALVAEAVGLKMEMPIVMQQMLMITIGIVQAFLFTFALTTLVDVQFFTWRRFVREALIVIIPSAVILVAFSTEWVAFIALVLFYVYKLVTYVVLFCRRYRAYERRMDDYFSDDERQRLHWVKRLFFAALTIGILAMLYALCPTVLTSLLFTAIMAAYYADFAVRFINYAFTFGQIEVVMTEGLCPAAVIASKTDFYPPLPKGERQLMDRLNDLMRRKELYTKSDLTIEELAVQMGEPYRAVSAAINNCCGTNFKSWVNLLRVEKAQRLIREGYLDIHTIDAMSEAVGFSSRSNFYRAFKAVTGQSPTDYQSGPPLTTKTKT